MNFQNAEFSASYGKMSQLPAPERMEFAFIGRSNVGKSSLINMLCGSRKLAMTSSTPGKTKVVNHFLINDNMIIEPASVEEMDKIEVLRGPNIKEFGDRFFDVTDMYTYSLRTLAKKLAPESGLTVHEGVYFFFTGPQFETPAEIRAARLLGGDAVGMSTVTEALTAAHCHLPMLCLSVMTNMAAGVLAKPLDSDEVTETGMSIAKPFSDYVSNIIRHIEEGL